MNAFEDKFKSSLKHEFSIYRTMHYIIKRKGTNETTVCFLCANIFTITSSTYTAASLIELLHTATLVHDDVIDGQNFRRGVFSVNALGKRRKSQERSW